MVHGPLTASNLPVTWRRRHGDAKVTRQLARSRDRRSKTPGWGTARFKVSAMRAPWKDSADNNLPERTKEPCGNQRGEETLRCFQIISFLPRQHWKPPLLPHPVQMLWHLILYLQVEYFCLCACVQGGLGFYWCLNRFFLENISRGLGPVNKTSA